MNNSGLVVFSDLDGTLLDHHNYQYESAMEALQALKDRGIPLVLASSKTAAEIFHLRAELGFQHCPAIVENGAGRLGAHEGVREGSPEHDTIIQALSHLPSDLAERFVGFSMIDIDQIVQWTGLSYKAAGDAAKRQFSEPGKFLGTQAELEAFIEALKEYRIIAQQGGRFLTLSLGKTKADQVKLILDEMGSERADRPVSIGLGDAPNDISMLQAVDYAVVIPNPSHDGIFDQLSKNHLKCRMAEAAGPVGWNHAVLALLDEIG